MLDPARWGLPAEAVARLGDDLRAYWEHFRPCFCTRTHDTSENAYVYLRGLLTLEEARNFANIERRLTGGDGQTLQQFMSDSPWAGPKVFQQLQTEIAAHPALQHGGVAILDDTADAKAGPGSIGASRQRNGRLGKVDLCVATTGLAYAHPATCSWALVDAELFLAKEWFTPAFAKRRKRLGLPADRTFATKLDLGLQMIRRARVQGLPFELVACDDSYGRSRAFRAALDADNLVYAAEVPGNTQVYLKPPKIGLPRRRHKRGRKPTRLKVVSRQRPHEVRQLARSSSLTWERVMLRHTERGTLTADFAVRRVWTLTEALQVRAEWRVIRRDLDGRSTFVLLNAPADTPPAVLRERSCQRYFTERVYQDAKSETGWDDFQAQKYRAWEHAVALTAAALWFVADVKLTWRETYARDPLLLEQFELQVLPALSTANVRDLLQAVLPVPHLTPQQARELVVKHLVNRARSTRSRLRRQHDHMGAT